MLCGEGCKYPIECMREVRPIVRREDPDCGEMNI